MDETRSVERVASRIDSANRGRADQAHAHIGETCCAIRIPEQTLTLTHLIEAVQDKVAHRSNLGSVDATASWIDAGLTAQQYRPPLARQHRDIQAEAVARANIGVSVTLAIRLLG